MSKRKLATIWLDGCSGCHMSFLDMDERLVELSAQFDLVYSPLGDFKIFPEGVDIALVEGAVSSDADLHKIQMIRERTKVLVSLGDCAVTGNVPTLRNSFSVAAILEKGHGGGVPTGHLGSADSLPRLLPHVRPVHEVVSVDVFVPGCPPSADVIYGVLSDLLAGRAPSIASATRFGV